MRNERKVRNPHYIPFIFLLIFPSFVTAGEGVKPLVPLSSLVAVSHRKSIPEIAVEMTDAYARGILPEGTEFPLNNTITDTVRTVGFKTSVVVKWLDPLTTDTSVDAPRFGANADFVAFMGDNWNRDWLSGVVGSSPMNSGSSDAGMLWVNHEYISNSYPTVENAPTGQSMTFASFLQYHGVLENDIESSVWETADVDTYVQWHKKQVGGSWFRVVRNPATLEWHLDLQGNNKRYDASDATRLAVVGYELQRPAHDDAGNTLPAGVVTGIMGDCSGGLSPWGTILTAEENVQSYYGDLETCWSSSNRFKSGEGFDPGSHISFNVEPGNTDGQVFGLASDENLRRDRDNYGFLAEMDPGADASDYYTSITQGGDGIGHRKIGAMGRVRWENATFAVANDWRLIDGKPVVIYGGNDRRSGRIYKFVSSQPYKRGMTRGQVRALLDTGDVFVAHFQNLNAATGITMFDPANPTGEGIVPTEDNPGQGIWIRLSLDNHEQVAPNAAALGAPGTTVGQALADLNWNGIGGFASNNDVLAAMFTASTKLGISEMNRPEDLEYNPRDLSGTPRIYVAFTNHTRPAACNQEGVLDGETPTRRDSDGSIFSMEEGNAGDPGASRSFSYRRVWRGTTPDGLDDDAVFSANDPDNIAIGVNGEVFFGTDGNPGSTGDTRADAIYYLDLDPTHKEGMPGIVNPSYGKAFRVVSAPGDAEATGPWFTPDQTTLFFVVQHPGEDYVSTPSTWPHNRTRPARLPVIRPDFKN